MSSPEDLKGVRESLVEYYTRLYSYDSAWEIPPRDGQPGKLSTIGRISQRGKWVYIVDELSRTNNRRTIGSNGHGAVNYLLEMIKEGSCQTQVPIVPNSPISKLRQCGLPSGLVIQDNGRWQDEMNLTTHCGDEHATMYMDQKVDSYNGALAQGGDWDFWNAPVFGRFTAPEGWDGQIPWSPFDLSYFQSNNEQLHQMSQGNSVQLQEG